MHRSLSYPLPTGHLRVTLINKPNTLSTMEFDLSKIEMSPSDIRRRIRLPKQMTVELAEFIGIIIGDGNLSYRVCSQNGYKIRKSDIRIAGNVNEGEYLSYVIELFENLFNITMYYREDKRSKAVSLTAHSMGILHFLNIICRIPLNRKVDNVNIPAMIMKSSLEIKYAFLRGLADTDFSVTFKNRTAKGHTYPVIKGTFKSKNCGMTVRKVTGQHPMIYSVHVDSNKGFRQKEHLLSAACRNGTRGGKISRVSPI